MMLTPSQTRAAILCCAALTATACQRTSSCPAPGLQSAGGEVASDSQAGEPETTFDEDVRALLDLTNAVSTAEQIMDPLITALAQSHPKVPDRVWREVANSLRDDSLLQELIEVYKKHYTREEVRGMLSFYRSPLGRSVVGKMPAVLADAQRVGQTYGMGLATRLLKEVQSRGYEL